MEDAMSKELIIDGSEKSVQDIVSKLRFIAKININEKLDVHTLTLYRNNWITSIYRTYHNIFSSETESKEITLGFIRQVIGDAFDLSTIHLNKDDTFSQRISLMIIQSLKEARTGLFNLLSTYKGDRMFISKIETLIQTLNMKTDDLDKIFETIPLSKETIKWEKFKEQKQNDIHNEEIAEVSLVTDNDDEDIHENSE